MAVRPLPAAFPRRKALPARLGRVVRRRWRCLRRWLRRPGVTLVYHRGYGGSFPGVPLDSQRGERILAFLDQEGLYDPRDVSVPRPPSIRNLLRVHSESYLESLQQPETVQKIFGVGFDDEILEQVIQMQRLMVGGTIQATRLAQRSGGIAVNLGGGMHHADRDSGRGFCIYNDVAVAVARLRGKGFKEPVLVVDLDLHDGDGTRAVFAQDPTVHTYSVHAEHWRETDAVASTAIALGPDVGDETYLGTVLKTLPDVVAEVGPGLVIYLAGVDVAADDLMGGWRVTAQGMLSRDRFVLDTVRSKGHAVPLVVVLGGGYGDASWRYSARMLSWLLAGRVIEPPRNEDLTLFRYRRLRQLLDPRALTSEGDGFSWNLTDEDLAGILPGSRRPTRFLGYFSRQGVELVLERFGILDQLRVRGYPHPEVEVDLGHPLGQTVRVWGDEQHQCLLAEARVRRDQRVVPGHEVMVVEWLLLQNPRAEFGPYRRPLPGQKHPGLGLLKEVLGWLLVVAEMLDLDGIYYAPSSYHVAAQSRTVVRFLKPEHEARFREMERLLEGVPLGVASQKVERGELVWSDSGEPLTWEGYPMVLPVSDRMKELVYGSGYEERVAAESGRVRLRLAGDPTGARSAVEEQGVG
jgi:acetoin utilization deacetylase AcuC-like enzyme